MLHGLPAPADRFRAGSSQHCKSHDRDNLLQEVQRRFGFVSVTVFGVLDLDAKDRHKNASQVFSELK